jgi:hypothetical protein
MNSSFAMALGLPLRLCGKKISAKNLLALHGCSVGHLGEEKPIQGTKQ